MTNSTAPVSAVMASYNSAATIGEAIQSVKAQTRPVAELIVVDDSTDGTAGIAETMGARVIHNGMRGLSAAMTRCVRESSQPWIAFLDADDVWEPRKIERQMGLAAQNHDVVLVSCDYRTFNRAGIIQESALNEYRVGYTSQCRRSCADGSIIDQLDASFADAYYFLLASNVFVRRDVLLATGLFDESLQSAMDFDCFMRVLALGSMGVVESVLVSRREHENSTSRRNPQATLSCLAATYKVLEHPELYPAATVKLCGDWLPANLRHAGARLVWNGEAKRGRDLLLESARRELSLRTLIALGASICPAAIARKLMKARYFFSSRLGI